jgi:hypothetical protein
MTMRAHIDLKSVRRFSPDLENGLNPFHERWNRSSDQEWLQVLLRSIQEPVIEGYDFPGMPDPTLQARIQGASNEASYRGAVDYYSRVKQAVFPHLPAYESRWHLDFGSGWGRTLRPFMRDFQLDKMIGYEPNPWFCQVARSLNPYVGFLNGPFLPDAILPSDRFSLTTSYSVFSHLPQSYAVKWLQEFARVTHPGGFVAFTTWGERFLNRLKAESLELEAGKDLHFYSKVVIEAIPDLDVAVSDFKSGKYLFFGSSSEASYGETFISGAAMQRLIDENSLPFTIHLHDTTSLAQDLFVIRRS